MDFRIEERGQPNKKYYAQTDIDIAYEFSKKIAKEFGTFLKCIVLFGSTARKESNVDDIDILVVIDDTAIHLSGEAAETYRVIVEKLISKTSQKIHVTTMKFTSFWEYTRAGDPIIINILREGVPILDTGFFNPMQLLLAQGRIRPSIESIWSYYSKAPATIHNAKWHILQATVDLYWAVIDVSHAVLMSLGEIPPTPMHVADLIEEKFVKTKKLNKKYSTIMRNFYKISKMIAKREIKEISGQEFDRYLRDANDYVEHMKKFIEG